MTKPITENGAPIVRRTSLDDALIFTVPGYCPSPAYARGVLVGLISGLEAVGWTGPEAVAYILAILPYNHDPACVPNSWREK